ncbi:hypothetical protein AVEN_240245-1 [Araneus ventricosus]|uniref:Uncharacterized protein n=1 Tax=Araneus ventricosus TaxID=182803 RepID=A0A4Y2SMR1_ARAVE|nr:hypothetical protein AVEN_240245-1 [Araneus ventricosus]
MNFLCSIQLMEFPFVNFFVSRGRALANEKGEKVRLVSGGASHDGPPFRTRNTVEHFPITSTTFWTIGIRTRNLLFNDFFVNMESKSEMLCLESVTTEERK